MRRYETLLIFDPELGEEERAPLLDRFDEIIHQQGGTLLQQDHWGTRRLAYEIKKKPRGYYLRLDYCGSGPIVDEIERFSRIDDRILKYMTVLLDPAVDVDQEKEKIAQAKAKAQALSADKAPVETPTPDQPSSEKADAEAASDGEAVQTESNISDEEAVQTESDKSDGEAVQAESNVS